MASVSRSPHVLPWGPHRGLLKVFPEEKAAHTCPGSPANPDRKPSPFSSPEAGGRRFVLSLLKKDFGLLCVPPRHCNLVRSHLRGPKLRPGPCAPARPPKLRSPVVGQEEAQARRTPLRRPRRRGAGEGPLFLPPRVLCEPSNRCGEGVTQHQMEPGFESRGWVPPRRPPSDPHSTVSPTPGGVPHLSLPPTARTLGTKTVIK